MTRSSLRSAPWACAVAALCLAACRGGAAVPSSDSSFAGHPGRENPLEHEIARYLTRIESLLGTRGAAGAQP